MKAYLDYVLDYYFDEENKWKDWSYDLLVFLIGMVLIFYQTEAALEISMLIAVPCAFAFRIGLLTLKFLLNKHPG